MRVIKEFYLKYEQYFPASFFVLGFLFDIFTLGRIDDFSNIFIQSTYLILLGWMLFLDFKEFDYASLSSNYLRKISRFKNVIFHFLLGSLLSAFTLFYFKSASLSNAFVFMILMSFLLILNEFEFFQKKGILVKSILFKLCQISFALCIIPLIFGRVGIIMFLLSVSISLVISYFFGSKMLKYGISASRLWKEFFIPHAVVAVTFIVLYIFKIIPPVPLSIQEIGIYHKVKKVKGEYQLYFEKPRWKFWLSGDEEFHAGPRDKVFVFLRLFSPKGFADKVYLHWQYKDYKNNWATSDRIELKIFGGRGQGYRGYAYKKNYQNGEWRVLVETIDGLEIGRIGFNIYQNPEKVAASYNIDIR